MRMALGAEDGEAIVNVTANSLLTSIRTPSTACPEWLHSMLVVEEQQKVPVARLDSVFQEFVPRADGRVFLKLDTQGWDLEVLRGTSICLEQIVGIQTELSVIPLDEGMPGWLEVMCYLSDRGFQPTFMAPVLMDGPVRSMEFDCMMVRGENSRVTSK